MIKTVPPCSSTMLLAMASPSPMFPVQTMSAPDPPGRNGRIRAAGDTPVMPQPVSATSTVAVVPFADRRQRHGPTGGSMIHRICDQVADGPLKKDARFSTPCSYFC